MKSELTNPIRLIRCSFKLENQNQETIGQLDNKMIAIICPMTFGVDLMSQLLADFPSLSVLSVVGNIVEAGKITTKAGYIQRLGEIDYIATLLPEQAMAPVFNPRSLI